MSNPSPNGGRLGATPVDGATRFEVWAPNANAVSIVLDEREVALEAVDHDDDPGVPTWIGVIDGVGHGDRYRIRLDGGQPLPDPVSRWQPEGVSGPSAVVDHRRFSWTDHTWPGVELADAVFYELHVGTFTPEGTFDGAIGHLPRLVELGITVIELMPVNAFPGERNWGYDGVFPFAVQFSYGGPEGLARFVDAAHDLGLAVVLDVVYNHLGPEGNVLGSFGPYFTNAYGTPWGPAVNVADRGSDGVRRYFVENAVGWVDDYHLDGFRFDAVHAIVDPTARPMMEEVVAELRWVEQRVGRPLLITLESAANDPRQVRPVSEHGWGADAVWNDDVHHSLRVALTGERHEYYAGYRGVVDLVAALEHRFVYRGQYSPVIGRRHGAPADDVPAHRFIVFSSNHDHVGNTPRGERLLHADGPAEPRRRLAAAFVLLSPFTPLLFMGEEYGETAPFPYFVDHADPGLIEAVRKGRAEEFSGVDWSGEVADPADPATFTSAVLDPQLATTGAHRGLLVMHRELLRLRRSTTALVSATATRTVARNGDVVTVQSVLGGETATTVFNFSATPVPLGVDWPEAASQVFDSEDPTWGGAVESSTGAMAPWSARLFVEHR